AMFYTVVVTDTGLGFGPTRLLGGLAFSLGLILVVVAGAELFTGNNLIVMAWADGRIGLSALLRNWGIVYGGNFLGAAASAIFIHWSGTLAMQNGAVAETALAIADAKISLTIEEAFARGILCNALVCLAIWLSYAARRVSGKILAIIFPITAFVALGFEHSVANMYFIPVAIMQSAGVTVVDLLYNLVPVTLGNIVGGAGFIGLVYWIVYCRSDRNEE
ncbi:MAG: formate/nitrite transporter family protein, partial [Rhodospirillaceae bacterium]|nr:formate/nitrite transporter family protein [Rhodospirillaceae bacterium]